MEIVCGFVLQTLFFGGVTQKPEIRLCSQASPSWIEVIAGVTSFLSLLFRRFGSRIVEQSIENINGRRKPSRVILLTQAFTIQQKECILRDPHSTSQSLL